MSEGEILLSSVWPADAALWPRLTAEERLLLDAARRLQGGDPGQPVGIDPLSRALGWGRRRVKARVDSLGARALWPIPPCRHGGWHGPTQGASLSNFELAARIQMAARQKESDQVATAWRRREANRLRAARLRAQAVRQRHVSGGVSR